MLIYLITRIESSDIQLNFKLIVLCPIVKSQRDVLAKSFINDTLDQSSWPYIYIYISTISMNIKIKTVFFLQLIGIKVLLREYIPILFE